MSFGRVGYNIERLKQILSKFDKESYNIMKTQHCITLKASGDTRKYLQSMIPNKYFYDISYNNGVMMKEWRLPYDLFDRNLDSPKSKE